MTRYATWRLANRISRMLVNSFLAGISVVVLLHSHKSFLNLLKRHVMDVNAGKTEIKDTNTVTNNITWIVGIIGSIVTILVAVSNSQTQSAVSAQGAKLQELEMHLKERATGLDESRERVDRYKWVLSLFPALEDSDERKRNFTISLMRLALTSGEAAQLFSSLQASPDKTLQSVGQSGITAIQNEPIAMLVGKMNASTAKERKATVSILINTYRSSSQAIDLALQLYDPERINALSPSGLINGLVFLKNTDPTAWKPQQVQSGKEVVDLIKKRAVGPQSQQVADELKTFLASIKQ